MEAPRDTSAPTGDVDSTRDWPVLLGKAIDDISRIAHAEIRLLGLHLAASIENAIDDALTVMMASAAVMCALLCFVAALIMLLRLWLAWWLAFGLAGVAMLIVGLSLYYFLSSRSRRTASVPGR
jgi:Putative Actinobacterial Holin-X, holin superfamily III